MTSRLAVKLRRDLRVAWPRMTLMVVAIAVSLTAFSAVLTAWSTIQRETERAYLSTEPASATIRFGPGVDTDQMAALAAEARARPGIREATGRTQFTSDVNVDGQPLDIPLQVFVAAPDDPLQMAAFFPHRGSWPPEPGEIYLASDSLSLLGVAVGDRITIERPDGQVRTLRVADTVYDPSLAPASQEQTAHGYWPGAAGSDQLWDQLKLQVAAAGQEAPSRDRDAVVAAATEVGEWLQAEHGLVVEEIQVPEPYAHPHQGQAEALLRTMLAGAGAALLLSTVLVANLLSGLFARQIPQIGNMKAIGARSGQVGRFYLAMTLVVAGAATVLALPAGILLGRAMAPKALDFLAVEPVSLAPAPWTYPVLLAAGLAMPVTMTTVPLVRASRATVRSAIDHHGGSAPRAGIGLLARLGRLGRLDRGLLLALRNTTRRPARFLLAAGLLASAGMAFVAGMSAREGMAALATDGVEQRRWDVAVQLGGPAEAGAVTAAVAQVPQVAKAEAWTVTTASIAGQGELPVSRTYPDQGHGRLALTAVPAGTTMLSRPTLREGRWLEPHELGAVVLNQVTLANADTEIRVGDTVELLVAGKPTAWQVVGIAEERGAASNAYVTAEGLAQAGGGPIQANAVIQANTVRIATHRHDEPTRQAAATAAAELLTDAGFEVRSAHSVSRQEAITGGHLEPILVILVATAVPMGIIGGIGLASTMSANVLERTREFGVMHAIGARPRAVRRIVVTEGVLVALASCLLAAVPAVVLTAAVGSLLGNAFMYTPLPFRFSLPAAGFWIAVVVIGAVLATEAAASRASRLTVREALAYL